MQIYLHFFAKKNGEPFGTPSPVITVDYYLAVSADTEVVSTTHVSDTIVVSVVVVVVSVVVSVEQEANMATTPSVNIIFLMLQK